MKDHREALAWPVRSHVIYCSRLRGCSRWLATPKVAETIPTASVRPPCGLGDPPQPMQPAQAGHRAQLESLSSLAKGPRTTRRARRCPRHGPGPPSWSPTPRSRRPDGPSERMDEVRVSLCSFLAIQSFLSMQQGSPTRTARIHRSGRTWASSPTAVRANPPNAAEALDPEPHRCPPSKCVRVSCWVCRYSR